MTQKLLAATAIDIVPFHIGHEDVFLRSSQQLCLCETSQ